MSGKAITGLVLSVFGVLFGGLLFASSTYVVDEKEFAIEYRLGEIKQVRKSPGFYVKAPFIDSIQRIDKRTLRADIPPREVPDQDKERLIIDTVVRYKIIDPVAFRTALVNESTAYERLQTIMYSAMRDTIAVHDRTEIIGAQAVVSDTGEPIYDAEGLPTYESLATTRDAIGQAILNRLQNAVNEQRYGISIISADIKRADFPPQVTEAIIERLRAERQRVSAKHHADGEEQYRKRTAAVQTEADILISEAERDARQIRGKGDAEAINIVQEALQKDTEFYTFLRTMESYETSIQDGALMILSDDGYLSMLTDRLDKDDARRKEHAFVEKVPLSEGRTNK